MLELADIVAVNKADGDRAREAAHVARELADALHLFDTAGALWAPQVLTCSALEGAGLERLWSTVIQHRAALSRAGALTGKRDRQQSAWMWAMVADRLLDRLRTDPAVKAMTPEVERELRQRTLTPAQGARRILDVLGFPDPPGAGS